VTEGSSTINNFNDTISKFKINEDLIDVLKLEPNVDITTLDCMDDNNLDEEELHKFLNEDALNDQSNKLSVTRLIYYDDIPIGYFTIAMYSILCGNFKEDDRPSTNTKIYPALILTNIAIDRKYRGRGFGQYVLKWVTGFGRVESKKIGCRYIALFARNAIEFYLKNNFTLCEGQDSKKYKLLVSLLL
jgi:GNAT superfamily N-acetyltransferase